MFLADVSLDVRGFAVKAFEKSFVEWHNVIFGFSVNICTVGVAAMNF